MLRALLLIARWIAVAHDRWRAEVGRCRPLAAEIDILHERLARVTAERDLLRSRLCRLPHRRRPRYRPWERLAILWHQARHGLSLRATARAFVVSVQTLVNWHREVAGEENRLVNARRPFNALPDLVADLVHRLKQEWPRWGTRRIAGILARLGLRASRASVQRILRRPRRPRAARVARVGRGPLLAKRPNHIWLIDFTKVGGPFRCVRVGAVLDAYSRKVLAIGVLPGEPTAAFAVRLLREAVAAVGVPVWVVSDHGTQFTSDLFRRALTSLGIRRRFGAVGRTGSISLIDRFFRSLKDEYARGLFLYRPVRSIQRDIRRYAHWYNHERPHWSLDLRSPDEVHAGASPRPAATAGETILSVGHLAGDRRLPILRLRRAA